MFPYRLPTTIDILGIVQRDMDGHMRGGGADHPVPSFSGQVLATLVSGCISNSRTVLHKGEQLGGCRLNQSKPRKGHVLCHRPQVLVNVESGIYVS